MVFVTAIGATLGKVLIYGGAFELHKSLQKNKNVRLLGMWIGKRGFYSALFITAIIPALPLDDYVYIGAGANRARLTPMLGVTFTAKLVKSAFEIFLEFTGILGVSTFLELSPLELSILLSVLFIVLGFVIYKVDWEPFVTKARLALRAKARLACRPTKCLCSLVYPSMAARTFVFSTMARRQSAIVGTQ